MIYLDSAATSLQKPSAVPSASARAIRTMASPGRGGHRSAMLAAETAYNCRENLAKLFNVEEPERVVFTLNATHALNIAIRSLAGRGDRVAVSGYEHNAVTRPLRLIGADIAVARSPLFDPDAMLEAFRDSLKGARAAVCTHVSNVFGYILPIYEIAELCRTRGVPLIVDASQSAGVLDIDAVRLGAEFIAAPGHKGLLGPQGTGVLLCCGDSAKPLLAGGTGSESHSQTMPDILPDMLEAGTHNICGIAGLNEGVRYVLRTGTERIERHERALSRALASELAKIGGMTVFLSDDPALQTGVLSVVHEKIGAEELASALANRGVAVRAGLHCAPFAHETAGTLETGTVRFSVSPFSTKSEIMKAAAITKEEVRKLWR